MEIQGFRLIATICASAFFCGPNDRPIELLVAPKKFKPAKKIAIGASPKTIN